MVPRIWRLQGRIGRGAYLAIIVPNVCVASALALASVHASPPLDWALRALLLPCGWTGICTQVRRLHDLGHPGWVALAMLVPFVDLGIAAYSLLRPGQPFANAYGPPPATGGRARN